ncbi:MAG: methyltransferase domain-containing protein [Nitrospirae bacterium]|nr:methyltransferase domain-containing protein [Nitrospirota bacterium]
MKRIPEPELMDQYEQARAYAEADFNEPNSLFVNLFKEHFPWLDGKLLMADLGCGPADITVRLARVYPEAEIHAIDGSEAMLLFAEKRLMTEALTDRIKLIRAFLPDDPLPSEGYDALFSNSLLHHLSNPAHLWSIIKRYGRSGSAILVMDLVRPESPDRAREIVETYSGNEPDVLKEDFFNSLCAAYTVQEVKEQLYEAGLDSLEVKLVSDRHLLVAGVLE